MAVHHAPFPHKFRHEEKEVKEPKKVPWSFLRLTFMIAAVAWLVSVVIFPHAMAIIAAGGIVSLFGLTLLYAKTLQRQRLNEQRFTSSSSEL